VDDVSLYKHIDAELPDPDRARQLTILCAARAPVPTPPKAKGPPIREWREIIARNEGRRVTFTDRTEGRHERDGHRSTMLISKREHGRTTK